MISAELFSHAEQIDCLFGKKMEKDNVIGYFHNK